MPTKGVCSFHSPVGLCATASCLRKDDQRCIFLPATQSGSSVLTHKRFLSPRLDLIPAAFRQTYYSQDAALDAKADLRLHFERLGYEVAGATEHYEARKNSPLRSPEAVVERPACSGGRFGCRCVAGFEEPIANLEEEQAS